MLSPNKRGGHSGYSAGLITSSTHRRCCSVSRPLGQSARGRRRVVRRRVVARGRPRPSLPHRTSRSSCLDWSHGPTRRRRRSLIWSHMFGPFPIWSAPNGSCSVPIGRYARLSPTMPASWALRFGSSSGSDRRRRSRFSVGRRQRSIVWIGSNDHRHIGQRCSRR